MVKTIERTKDGMDSLIDGTRDAVTDAAERAERGIDSVAKKTHAAGAHVCDGAEKVSRSAHRHLEDAAKAVDRGYARARSDLSRTAMAATDYVAENPCKTLVLAASTGFGLGMLVRWRFRRPERATPATKP
jgi:ElaB/YqjD/DUF883 family membrane-anchored ribosome-binding protein